MRSIRAVSAIFSIAALLLLIFSTGPRVSLAEEGPETFWGPETFVRTAGQPLTETRTISTFGYEGPFTLHVRNGDDAGTNLSAGSRVMVDGVQVLGPAELATGSATNAVALELGDDAVLAVQVQGRPGAQLTVWIEGQPVELAHFFTAWDDGESGVIERLHTVEIGSPSPLDVDNEFGADLFGTLEIGENGMFMATIERAPGVTKALPVSVEAVVGLEPGAPFGRLYAAFGYDQLESSAPEHFSATFTLGDMSLSLDFEQEGISAATTTSVIATLFDGEVDEREETITARGDYQASPSIGGITADFDSLRLLLSSNMSGAAVAWVEDNTDDLFLRMEIDGLPGNLAVSLDTALARLSYQADGPVNFLRVDAAGSDVLLEANDLKVEFNQAPDSVSLDFSPAGSLVSLQVGGLPGQQVGQVRLVLSDGTSPLPARSVATLGDPVLNDVFRVHNAPGATSITARLTALKALDMSLDPFDISLEQDSASTRPIELEGIFGALGDAVTVTALLNRPHEVTAISAELQPGEPIRFGFNNSANLQRFEFAASGIEGSDSVVVTLDNVSRRMGICIDSGPGCQRPNPHSVQRYATAATTVVSMDLDDFGTHGSGSGPAFRTTLNATIDQTGNNDAIRITNVRFRNLGFDVEDSNNPHNSNCGSLPRLSMFFDSRGHPFVVNQLVLPELVQDLGIGTDTNPARASNRISRINGWSTGFFGCLGGFNQSHAGGLGCGGQSQAYLRTSIGTINAFNFLTFQWNVCGGTVTNPQPW